MSTLEALVSLENQKSIEADDFLSHLSSPLQQYVQDSITLTSTSSSSSNNISMTERIDTFEISTRSHALSLANNLSDAKEDDTKLTEEAVQDLLSFIRSVIDVLLHISYQYRNKGQVQEGKEVEVEYCPLITSSQFRKLPFLLLEDLVDTLPTQTIMKIWNHGPGVWLPQLLCKTEQSENPDVKLFHQGSQYCVLRLCNKILKNLSVSSSNSQAQFAGTITMTLASVFPLSERSAVNVLGAFNTNSKVEYESLEDWWKTNSSSSGSTTDKNNREGTGGKKDGGSKIASTLNYEFYKTFWELQENFTDPTKLLPKDTAKDKNMWVENMNTFIGNAEMVLGAFEDNKFPNQLVKEHKNRWNQAKKRPIPTSNNNNEAEKDECAMDVDVDIVKKQQNEQNVDTKVSTTTTTTAIHSSKRHYKYITNSQLLHLQLKDPKVRMNILTQFFIILEYLSQSLLSNTTLHKISIEKINSSLVKLEHRAGELLKLTPPNGEIQYNTLKWVLKEREMVWRQWKKNKCVPKIEKFYQEKDSKSITKPRSGKSKDSSSLESLSNLYSYKIDLKTELPSISSSIVESHTPNIFEFLEDYVEALDPEAGIEAEYHPKNDKLFAWRAMRLLSDTKYIGILGGDKSGHKMINLKNGDFEGLVRKMWKEEKGEDIPGELPIYESSDEEIEEVQKEEEKGKNQEEGEKGEEKDDAELNNGADDSTLKGQTTPQKEEGEDEATSAKKIENDGNNGKRSDSGELKVDEKNVSNEMNGKDSNGQHIPAKNDVKNDVKKDNQEALESDTPKSKQTTRSNDVKVEFTNNSAENKRKREDNAKTPVKDRDVKKVKYEKSQKSKTNEAKEPVHQQKSDTKSSNQISRGAHINKKTNSSTNTQGGKTDSFTNAEGRKTNSSTNAEGGKTHSSTNDEGGKTIFSTNTTQGGKTSSSSNTQGGKTNSSTNAEGGKTNSFTNTQGGKTSSSSNTQGGRPLRSQNVATRRVDDRKGNVDREFAPHQRPAQIMRPNQRHDGRHMRQTPPPPQQPLPSEGRHPMGNRRPDRRFGQDNVSNPGRYHQGGRDGGRRGGNQGGNQGGPGGQRPGGSHETTGQQRRRGGRR